MTSEECKHTYVSTPILTIFKCRCGDSIEMPQILRAPKNLDGTWMTEAEWINELLNDRSRKSGSARQMPMRGEFVGE